MNARRIAIQTATWMYFLILFLLQNDFFLCRMRFLSLPEVGDMEYSSFVWCGRLSMNSLR